MSRVAVIGARENAVMFARYFDVDVVLFDDSHRWLSRFPGYMKKIHIENMRDGDRVIREILHEHRSNSFDRVISTTENYALLAANVSSLLGIPGNSPEAVQTLMRKDLTREAFNTICDYPIRFCVAESLQDVLEFWSSTTGKIVLKGLEGTASSNVHVAATEVELRAAWLDLERSRCGAIIVEEYLAGECIASVEAFSANGHHLTVGITQYRPDTNFVERELESPGDLSLSFDFELRSLTTRLLDAVGVFEGPSHTEFVLTNRGPRLLESHSRLAGAGIPELVRRSYGFDFWRAMLSVPLGVEALPQESPGLKGFSRIKFLTPSPGTIKAIKIAEGTDVPVVLHDEEARGLVGLEDLREYESGIVLQMSPGFMIPEIKTGFDLRMGYVISSGQSSDRVAAQCESLTSSVTIDYF